jgi:transposase
MCEDAGVRLEYLPPYSPDYNPIEEAFAELKMWMRTNYLLAESFETLEGFLELGLTQMSSKAGKHFRSAGIKI